MPWLPPTPGARALTASGFAGLVVSLWAQGPMWAVEFGRRAAAPGGGEHLAALFHGAPALLLASLLLGLAATREPWRSRLGVALVLLCLLDLSTWALLFSRAAAG